MKLTKDEVYWYWTFGLGSAVGLALGLLIGCYY